MRFVILILIICPMMAFTQSSGSKTGFIRAKSLSIYYEITGKGLPVFLLHAGLQESRMWDQQVITLDLPAHGKTTGSDTII